MAGQIEHKQAVAWAESQLGQWEPGPAVLWEPAPPEHHGPNVRVEFKDTEQAQLSFSFSGLARSDPDRFALRLLNVMMGEGMRSRLFQEVRERLGLAYSVGSYVGSLQDTGVIGVYAGVAGERIEKAGRAIVKQLDRLRQEPVPQDELDMTREFITGRFALSLEDSFAQAAWYARQELLGPEILNPEEMVTRFEAVQGADIQRIAQTLFQTERLNLAIVGPFSENGDRFRQAVQF
jgi:predicted Zn-dependent peptidase